MTPAPPLRSLVTGGAGYIGSHLVVSLLQAGHEVVVVDDLSSGHLEALRRAENLGGGRVRWFAGDIDDPAVMASALRGVDVVFHLAARKQVWESVLRPEAYLAANVGGTTALLDSMQRAGVTRLIHASSAAVYGTQSARPIVEDAPLRPESPYGLTKAQVEAQLATMARCRGWSTVSLRYFNPVGAHPSGMLGEPPGHGASLVSRALGVLASPGERLCVFGTDHPTPDRTALRDYLHVCDLARIHLAVLPLLRPGTHGVFNVGSGRAVSVREVLATCARVTGRPVPQADGPRRPGDVPVSWADPTRLAWATGIEPDDDLDAMVAAAWRWVQANPRGYGPAGRARPSSVALPV